MAGESDTFSTEVPMEIPKQLIDCLDQNTVQYEILHHSEAVTAQRIAQAEHIKGRHQAKVVMLKSGDQHLMVVLPADHHIDLEKIEKAIGKPVSLGNENDFKSMFAAEKVGFINVDGAIGPATASYISRSIEEAKTQNVQCLVIQLNTPGGLLDSTQKIVQSFLGSPVPVVIYVAPTGATATSAGCFITVAASVAAMAPATTIGAAHPVSIGGFPSGGEEKTDETMKQKLENFSVSYIETIAGKRQRNVEWAKSAVKESASITAEKALQLKVIDLIASDIPDLLQKLNGRVVDGKTLKTAGAEVSEIKMSASEHVFQKLATRSDVHSHADRDLRNHWRDDHTGSDSSWSRWNDRAGPRALSRGRFAGQRDRPRPHRARVDAVYLRRLRYYTRCLNSRRHHSVSDRLAHALQSRRPALSLIVKLHYSRDIGHCGVLYFYHRERPARATVADKSGEGNAHWENGDCIDPDRFAQRSHFRGRRILERHQRYAYRKRRAG